MQLPGFSDRFTSISPRRDFALLPAPERNIENHGTATPMSHHAYYDNHSTHDCSSHSPRHPDLEKDADATRLLRSMRRLDCFSDSILRVQHGIAWLTAFRARTRVAPFTFVGATSHTVPVVHSKDPCRIYMHALSIDD